MGKTIGSDNKIRKQYIGVIIAFYFIYVALMIIGTFKDLQIDIALFNYGSKFGNFMEQWGMLVAYIAELGSFSAVIACMHKSDELKEIVTTVFPFLKPFSQSKAGEKIFFIFHKIVYGAFLFGLYNASLVSIKYVFRRIYGHSPATVFEERGTNMVLFHIVHNICIIALAALSVLIFALVKKKLNKKQLRLMESMAGITLLMMVVCMSIDVLKDIFTRIRFREMIAYSHGLLNEDGMTEIGSAELPREWVKDTDFSSFDYWFKKGDDLGVYSNASSFPSGHTSGASYSLLLIPLFYKGREVSSFYEKYFIPASIVGIAYISAMAVSRLIMGAHYLTDVSMAALIMFSGCILCSYVITKFEGIYDKNLNK